MATKRELINVIRGMLRPRYVLRMYLLPGTAAGTWTYKGKNLNKDDIAKLNGEFFLITPASTGKDSESM